MSKVKIQIRTEGYGFQIPRTTVCVDKKFAYQSGNTVAIEHENLQKLIELLQCENTEVISIYSEIKNESR